jgi:hypothetical protein
MAVPQYVKDRVQSNLIDNFGAPISLTTSAQSNNYVVGDEGISLTWKLGPSEDISGVTHEVAHIVTDRDEQILKWGHGFKYGEYGQASTAHHIEKEIETMWVEYVMLKDMLDLDVQWDVDFVSALDYLPGTFLWKQVDPLLEKVPHSDYREAYLSSLLRWGYQRWTLENLTHEYKRKVDILNAHFE